MYRSCSELSQLSLVGLSYGTATVAEREAFALDGSALPQAYRSLAELGLREATILSTCNRTEIYAFAPNPGHIVRYFRSHGSEESSDRIDDLLYLKSGDEALEHLFRVASGLESQVLGETEILGQIRKSWFSAKSLCEPGLLLESVFERAFACGKRVRTETPLGVGSLSIGSLAVRLASDHHRSLDQRKIAVIGTGEMGKRIVQDLADRKVRDLYVVSHTFEYAKELASSVSARPLSIAQIREILPTLDVMFTATTAPHTVVDASMLEGVRVSSDALTVIDLGMPRNTAPEVAALPFIQLFDLDNLRALSENHRKSRESAIPAAIDIIQQELLRLNEWLDHRQVVPVIRALQTHAEQVRQEQLAWALPKLGELSERESEVIEFLTKRIVKQLLNSRLSKLKEVSRDDRALRICAEAFGLPRETLDLITEQSKDSDLNFEPDNAYTNRH